MPTVVRLSGVQMVVSRHLQTNLPKILEHIAAAAEDGADLVLFPEMSLSGYHGAFSDEEVSGALDEVSGAAKGRRIAVIVGTGMREDNGTAGVVTRIQNRAYSTQGELLGTHEKMVPTSGDREYCTPGEELRTFTWNGITCGSLICNDLWVTPGCGPYPDPRLTYQLGQMGAKIIFHAINSGAGTFHLPYHESNVALRAKESSLYIATANAADMDAAINCATGVMAPHGQWLTRLDRKGEGRYLVELSIE